MSDLTRSEHVVVEQDFLQRGNHHNVTNRDAILQQLKTFLLHQFEGSTSLMVSGRNQN